MTNNVNSSAGSASWGDAAPVLAPDFSDMKTYPNGDVLPSIWVTVPVVDENEDYIGRTCIMKYPSPYDDGYSEDTYGWDALYYGGGYVDEGMSYADAADHDKRIDCFKAAEILYRHSEGRGNVVASMCLGYLYSYNRCEGDFYVDPSTSKTSEGRNRPYPREERAFECFRVGAEADICEACYKLGDQYKNGVGCEPNAAEAFRWYVRASELMESERPVILGSVALRLGTCYEDGFGCELDFARALEWYRKAVEGLEIAVEHGEVWYTKALANARAGVKRCAQEVIPPDA